MKVVTGQCPACCRNLAFYQATDSAAPARAAQAEASDAEQGMTLAQFDSAGQLHCQCGQALCVPKQGPAAQITAKCQTCSGGFVLGAAAAGMQLSCACGSLVQVPDLILELAGPAEPIAAEPIAAEPIAAETEPAQPIAAEPQQAEPEPVAEASPSLDESPQVAAEIPAASFPAASFPAASFPAASVRLPVAALPQLYSIEIPPQPVAHHDAVDQESEPIARPALRLPITAFPELYSIEVPPAVPASEQVAEPIRLPVTALPQLYSIEIQVPPVVAQPEPIRLPVTAFPDLYSIEIPVPPVVSQPEPVAEPIRLPVTAVPELYQIAVPEKLLDRQSRIPRQELVDADVMFCPGCGLSHSADLAGRQFTCRCGQQFPDAALGVLDELMQYNLVPFQPIAIDRTGAVPGPDLRMVTVPAVSGSFDQATANAVAIVSGDVAKDVSSAGAMVRGWTWRQWGLGVLATCALSLTAVALLWDRHAGTVASTEQGYRIPLMAAEPLRVDPIRPVEDKRVVGADAKSGKEALVAWSPELDSTAVPAVVPVGVIETAVESIESGSEIEQANIEKANADPGGLLSQDLLAVPLSLAKGFEQQELLSEIALRQFAESVTALGERQAELKLSDLLWLADRWESYAQRAETHELAARCYWQAAAAMAMSREVAGSGVAEVASYQQRQELLTQKSHAETRMVSAEQGLRR